MSICLRENDIFFESRVTLIYRESNEKDHSNKAMNKLIVLEISPPQTETARFGVHGQKAASGIAGHQPSPLRYLL